MKQTSVSAACALLAGLFVIAPSWYDASIAGAKPKKPKPCATSLDKCPLHGCAKTGSPDAILNERKRTAPTDASVTLLTLDDFADLQDQADDLVGQGPATKLTKKQRTKLKGLTVSSGKVAEGDLVQVLGYIVGHPHDNRSGESVNCRLKGRENNDFHITLAEDPDETEFAGIVVEMIPQNRPEGWALKKLRKAEKQDIAVLVRGQLFYDNKHFVNADPDEEMGGQPKRLSLWEVHPVTEFRVCVEDGGGCDPKGPEEWKLLEEFE